MIKYAIIPTNLKTFHRSYYQLWLFDWIGICQIVNHQIVIIAYRYNIAVSQSEQSVYVIGKNAKYIFIAIKHEQIQTAVFRFVFLSIFPSLYRCLVTLLQNQFFIINTNNPYVFASYKKLFDLVIHLCPTNVKSIFDIMSNCTIQKIFYC